MVASLARASLDGAILVGAIWVLSRLLRLAPATRTILWWCAAAKFVVALAWTTPIALPILPAGSGSAAIHRAPAAPVHVEAPLSGVRRATPVQPTLGRSFLRSLREWSSFAGIGWALGLVLVAIAALRAWRETARMRDSSEPAPERVQACAVDLASRLRLRRVPEVRVSQRVATPLVTGFVRPVVLLPSDGLAALTDRERQMALCHELAHLKRADLWLGCVPALAERVFFFHPLAHLASREYALAREAACDAAVMETLDAAPREYARVLLALGVSHPRPGLTAAGAAWSFLNLKRRIVMLQDVSGRSRPSRILAAGVVGLAAVAMAPVQLAVRPEPGRTSQVAAPMPSTAGLQPADPSAARPGTNSAASAQADEKQTGTRELNFVLLHEDDHQTTSGRPEDVRRARQHQRNGEPLLWFRYAGREYVIRDREVLREARTLWASVYESGLHPEMTDSLIQTFKDDALAKHAELAAAGALAAADLGSRMAEQGSLGAELGKAAAEQALRALTDARMAAPEIEHFEMDRHVRSMTEAGQELEGKLRAFEQRFESDLEGRMQELERRLHALEAPMREMSAPMEEFGRRMEAFGRTIDEATRKASEEMRALIDRAVASGLARPVR